jgi:hypothetical protein
MIKIGFFLFLGFIPYLGVKFSFDFYVSTLNAPNEILIANYYYTLINVPAIILFFLVISGLLKIMIRYAWAQPVFYKEDFITGVKENWTSSILFALIIGLINIIRAILTLYQINVYVSTAIFSVSLVFIYPLLFVFTFVNAIYVNPFLKNISIALRLLIRRFPLFLVFFLLCYAFTFIDYIPSMVIKYTAYLIALIILVPIAWLASTLFSLSVFDELINKNRYCSLFQRGLRSSFERKK